MVQGGKNICFPLKILDNGLPDEWIGTGINHFLHSHQLDYILKSQVACPIYRSHSPHTNHILDQVPILQDGSGWQLLDRSWFLVKILRDAVCIQCTLPVPNSNLVQSVPLK